MIEWQNSFLNYSKNFLSFHFSLLCKKIENYLVNLQNIIHSTY